MKPVRGAMVMGWIAAALSVPLACAIANSPSGPGEECFAAADCAPGLVCVPQRGGARLCSSDLSQITGRPPPEAGGAEAGPEAEGGTDAEIPVEDAAGQDTSTPDTGVDAAIVDAAEAG